MRSKILLAGGAALLSVLPFGAFAHDYKIGSLLVAHPWSRATPNGAKVGSGYLTITNTGPNAERLMGGLTPAARRVSIHAASIVNGIARMNPVEGGLEIKPGDKVELKPGGAFHLMLEDLRTPLKAKEQIPLTLNFHDVGTLDVYLTVEAMGAEETAGGHDGTSHGGSGGQP